MGSRLVGVALESTLSQGLAGPWRGNPFRVNRLPRCQSIRNTGNKGLVKTEGFIYCCLLAVSESASFQASALPLKCIYAEVDT